MKTIVFTEEEWEEVERYLEDKQRGIWSDESWPHQFAYLLAGIIEKQS